MTRIEVLRPFVERTIAQYLGIDDDQLQTWDDGTIPIRAGSSVVNVRLLEAANGHPLLQAFAPLLSGIQKTPALLEKLNEVNASLTFARAFWLNEQVILSTELRAESLDHDQLAQIVSVLSLAANFWDGELKKDFGGETAFPEEPLQQAPEASDLASRTSRTAVTAADAAPVTSPAPSAPSAPPAIVPEAEERPPAGYI